MLYSIIGSLIVFVGFCVFVLFFSVESYTYITEKFKMPGDFSVYKEPDNLDPLKPSFVGLSQQIEKDLYHVNQQDPPIFNKQTIDQNLLDQEYANNSDVTFHWSINEDKKSNYRHSVRDKKGKFKKSKKKSAKKGKK